MNRHGGNIRDFTERYGLRPDGIIDFSSNINPLGVPGKLKDTLAVNLDRLSRYPDPEYRELRACLSSLHGVPENSIVPGNGAAELIYLAVKMMRPKRALILSPSFSEYEKALSLEGCRTEFFRLHEKNDFLPDLDELKSEISRGLDAVILCNPNNPTGRLIPSGGIEDLARRAEERDCLVMIDESFMDFAGDESAIALFKERKNLVVVRSFTKFYAIPGLRLGYAVCADTDRAASMMRTRDPWSVNVLASIAGPVLLSDSEYRERTIRLIETEKEFLFGCLAGIPALKAYRSDANFILCRIVTGGGAGDLQAQLAPEGIMIRDCSNFRFLDGNFFRIAVKSRADNERLVRALGRILTSKK